VKPKRAVPFWNTAIQNVVKKPLIGNVIKQQAKQEGNIIYGARGVQGQIGFFARGTDDWDVFTNKPKSSANKTQKALDKLYGYNQFYSKPALHPGTHKVMNKGLDKKQGTEDDYGVADYTQMPKPKPRFVIINGVKYRNISQESAARRKAIRDKAFAFRHAKDRADLNRIRLAQRVKSEAHKL